MKSGIKSCSKAYAEKFGTTQKEAEKIVRNVISVITDELLNNDEVMFLNNFTIKKINRKKRIGRNPKTGETFDIPANVHLKITVGKELKERLNRKL